MTPLVVGQKVFLGQDLRIGGGRSAIGWPRNGVFRLADGRIQKPLGRGRRTAQPDSNHEIRDFKAVSTLKRKFP